MDYLYFEKRKSGIHPVKEITWGTSFCYFYQTNNDLLDVLVPYFRAGLRNNEHCIWITSGLVEDNDLRAALVKAIPRFHTYIEKGQFEIIPFDLWHTKSKRPDAVIVSKLDSAVLRGFDGLRLAFEVPGNKNSRLYSEAELTSRYNVIAVFAYPRDQFDAAGIMQVMKNYRFSVVRNVDKLEVIESSEANIVKDNLRSTEEKLSNLFSNMSEGFAHHRIVLDNMGKPCDYVFLEVNGAFAKLTGLMPDNIIGQRVTRVLPDIEKDPTNWIEKYGKVAMTGEPAHFESYSQALGKWYSVHAFSAQKGFFAVTFTDITDVKQSELAMLNINRRLSLAYEAAGAGAWDWDIGTGCIEWSPRMFTLFGLDQNNTTASFDVWKQVVHPEDRDKSQEKINQALREHKKLNNEYRIVLPDGQIRWINALGLGEYDENGNPVRMVGTCTDITEQKRADEILRLNEARLESLLRITQYKGQTVQDWLDYALDQAINLTGSKIGYIYYYNEQNKEFRLNTWSKGVMAECSVTEPQSIYHLEKTGIWGEAVRQRRSILVNDFDAPNPLKKGFPKGHAPIRRFLTIPVLSDNKIVAVVGVANKQTDYDESDIRQLQLLMDAVWKYIDKQEAEEVLRETKNYLENLINYANAPIIVWNPEYQVTRFNQAFERLTGLAGGDVLGKELDILFPKNSCDASMELIRKLATGERWEIVEIPILRTDGTVRRVLWNSANIYDADGVTQVATIAQGQDITELKNTQEQLLAYERLATIGKVSGSIAHEIRNPLAVIDSSLFFLGQVLPDSDERIKTHLNRINTATNRCISVIQALLKLTHPEELRIGSVNLNNVIDIALNEHCRESITRIVETSSDEIKTIGDQEQLRIALGNIILNSVQAMNGAGTLTVTMRANENNIEIGIKDTGTGIQQENLTKIFEPLFSTKAKGTGLGLPIAKAIIDMHKGNITVASEVGKGTVFTIKLPLLQTDVSDKSGHN